MFIKTISSPIAPLNQNFFKKISRPYGEFDWSLSCLGVALLRPRIDGYSGIYGGILNKSPEQAINHARTVLEDKKRFDKETILKEPSIYYYCIPMSAAALEKIRTAMTDVEELKPIEAFVKQQLSMDLFAAYISKETNSAFIFTGTGNLALYHLCLAFIYNLLPAVFENKPLTQDEIQIVKALNHKTPDMFIGLVSKALMPLKPELMRAELEMCFKGFREVKIRTAEQNVQNKRNQAEQYLREYKQIMEQVEQAIIMYEGLKVVNGESEVEQELIDYLVTNPCLHNIRYNNGCLDFDVTTVLTNYDVMKWRNAIRQHDIFNSYKVTNDSNVFKSAENRKILLNALFNTPNPELNVKIRGHIILQINRSYMDVARGEQFDESNPIISNCLSNPHFKLHGCPGQNRGQIIDCLNQADIMMAIEASIAATGSVNIGETDLTFRPFVAEILNSEKRIIRRNDGVDMTPAEALLWLTTKENVA